jgi:hypothetical protein
MRTAKAGLPLLVIAVFIAARLPNLRAPFVNLLDTGFQEAIALHHLAGQAADNYFLPVISEVDGAKVFHTAHPPLLHLLYAGLYGIFGVHEWVSRLAALALYLASLGLGLGCLTTERRSGFLFFALGLFLPLPFALALTTNYEPLSLLAVTLVAVAFVRWQQDPRRLRLLALLFAVLLACLSDWPAYLAVPVLLLLQIRQRKPRKLLLALLLLEAAVFAAILFWQDAAAGEIVFFSHAATRNNPLALLQPQTYLLLRDHLLALLGPAPLLLAAALFLWLLKERAAPSPGLRFFLLYFLVLFLAAPQLVSKHEVSLYYLVPALVFTAHDAIARSPRPWLLLAIALGISFPLDYQHAAFRNYRYYFIAQQVQQYPEIRLAFSTPAIGVFRYYDGIETLFPTSAAATRRLRERPMDLIALDLKNPEVAPAINEVREYQDGLRLRFAFRDEQYYIREDVLPKDFYLAVLSGWQGAADWRAPRPEVIPTPFGPAYAIRQHPAGLHPVEFRFIEPGRFRLDFAAAIQHPFPFRVQSDGAGFTILSETDAGKQLLFSRFLPDPAGQGAFSPDYSLVTNLSALSALYVITDPGPRNNFAFDDACWLSARVDPGEGNAP